MGRGVILGRGGIGGVEVMEVWLEVFLGGRGGFGTSPSDTEDIDIVIDFDIDIVNEIPRPSPPNPIGIHHR
ncbi:MAG: hypothetical protein R2828_18975 [Saprospiraceae bacterium]